MARNNYITNSLVAGQVSPKFWGRTETTQYNQSAETIKNMLVSPQGGVGRRTGSIIVRELLDSAGDSLIDGKVVPFYTTDGQRVPLVLTQFFGNGTYKQWQASSTEFITLDAGWLTSVGDTVSQMVLGLYNNIDLSRLQYAQSADVMYFAYEGVPPFEIRYIATNPSGKKFIFRPLTNTIEYYLHVTELEDPANAWRAMPFMAPVVNKPLAALKLTSGAALAPITLEANVPYPTGTVNIDSTWVNKIIKFTKNATTTYVFWVVSVSGSVATVQPIGGGTYPNSTATVFGDSNVDNFYEDAYWDGVKGYPRTVTFFEGRLIFGGTRTFPDLLFYSMVNNIYRFDQRRLVQDTDYADPIVTTDPFTSTLKNTGRLNEIRWLLPSKTISVGTNFSEFIVQGPSNAKTIGIDNIGSSAETPFGSSESMAVKIENTTVFITRSKRQLREFVYSFDETSYKANNLNLLAEDIAFRDASSTENEGYFREMAMQESPNGLLWVIDTNGRLACLTRERSQEVNAWSSHELSGIGYTSDPSSGAWVHTEFKPRVQSIAVLQKATDSNHYNGEPDELYMVVQRGINDGVQPYLDDGTHKHGVQKLFLEVFAAEWVKPSITAGWDVTTRVAPVYMDAAYLSRSADEITKGNAAGVIGPLPHGVGDSVSVVIDGRYIGEFTVGLDFKIDITAKLGGDTSYNIIVGYNYVGRVIPVTPEVPATTGSSQGILRRVESLVLFFHRTIGARFGRVPDEEQVETPIYDMEEVLFPVQTTTDGNPPHIPMFTGNKKVVFPLGTEIRPRVLVESHIPLPMHLTHVVAKMTVSEA